MNTAPLTKTIKDRIKHAAKRGKHARSINSRKGEKFAMGAERELRILLRDIEFIEGTE